MKRERSSSRRGHPPSRPRGAAIAATAFILTLGHPVAAVRKSLAAARRPSWTARWSAETSWRPKSAGSTLAHLLELLLLVVGQNLGELAVNFLLKVLDLLLLLGAQFQPFAQKPGQDFAWLRPPHSGPARSTAAWAEAGRWTISARAAPGAEAPRTARAALGLLSLAANAVKLFLV